jgi:CPA1 family monovalent cation:H+ antiporter
MPERHLLCWIAPRGIVAAAITAIFAIKLEALGYVDAHQLVPLTFMVIIGTVLLQSTTARFIAEKLDVAEPEPRGFLLVGANTVAQGIGEALMEHGCKVLLADQNWSLIRDAKLKGLPAYWGNPVSEHAERHLNLVGIGHLLALSSNIELNALATQYYRQAFEPRRIFSIRVRPRREGRDVTKTAFRYGGRVLFDDEITYRDLEQRLREGADIRRTTLTDEFSFKEYLADQSLRRLPLFAIDDADSVHVFTPHADFTPKAGWSILALSWQTAQPEQAQPDPES